MSKDQLSSVHGPPSDLRPLPEGWTWTTLGESCDIVLGQSPSSDTYNADGNGLPFYQGKAEFGDLYPTPEKWCSSPKKIAEENDILITVRAPVGPTNLCPEKSCIGRGLAAIRPRNGMPTRFFLYYLRYIEKEWDSKATGTTFKAITGDVLRNQEMPLPPLPEQERIVARLEELLSDLEAGGAALERVRAGVKRYKASVLKAACEGRLFGDKPQGLPVGWQTIEFKEIIRRLKNGFFYGRPSAEPPGIPILRISAVRPLSVNLNEPRYIPDIEGSRVADYFLAKSDLLFTRYNGNIGLVGACGLVREIPRPTIYPDKLIRVNIDQDSALPDYIEIYFATQTARKFVESRVKSTAGQHGIAGGDIRSIPITLPPLDEQRRIVAEVERRLESARAVESAVEAGLKRAARLRQAVLRSAFEGRLG